jgi:SAM-dependent methyltransferase
MSEVREVKSVFTQIAKNAVMGVPFVGKIRSRLGAGRTTGSQDARKAFDHAENTLLTYLGALRNAGLGEEEFHGKTILEIGPGANLGVALSLICRGASKVVSIDRFHDLRARPVETELYTRIVAASVDDTVIDSRAAELDARMARIQYIPDCPIEDASDVLDHCFDIVISHLVMEHTRRLDRAIAAVSNLLVPGGLALHVCNLQSLGDVPNSQERPLQMLTYSPLLWRLMFSNRGGSNRHRANFYKDHLMRNGLEIVSFRANKTMELGDLRKIHPSLHGTFRCLSDEDLSILRFEVVARKPACAGE